MGRAASGALAAGPTGRFGRGPPVAARPVGPGSGGQSAPGAEAHPVDEHSGADSAPAWPEVPRRSHARPARERPSGRGC
eukprot:5865066-Alexandrium_andersonii.AAC.1